MSLTPSLPSSFQLASDEVHSWCASPDVPTETSARLYATLTPDELTRSARLIALPSRLYAEAFFSCWTKKEAYLKACGKGLAIPLNSFSVPLTTDRAHTPVDLYVASKDIVPANHWSRYTLRPAPGYARALAIEGSGWRLSQWQWRMPQG